MNDSPNPYRRIHPWGGLPAGTKEWAAVIGAEPGPDGNIYIEDIESTAIEHSGAEGVGVDAEGNVYGAVVRRRMLEKHARK